MSLRFLLGPAGAGKTHTCLDEICRCLHDGLEGPPLFLLVPEQATFQMERALLRSSERVTATARARVVSFKRLAHLALEAGGPLTRTHLGEIGKLLALQVVAGRRRDTLRVFGGAARTEGFLEQMAATIGELRAHRHGPDALTKARKQLSQERLLAGKVNDVATVFSEYQAFLTDRFHDPDEALDLANDALLRTDLAAGARIWVDGFAGFTPQEYAFLATLLGVASDVTVALCLDPGVLEPGGMEQWEEGPEEELFHPIRETLVRLRDLAYEQGIGLDPPHMLGDEDRPSPRFTGSPFLGRLERALAHRDSKGIGAPGRDLTVDGDGTHALVVEAPDRHGEVEAAAREILRLVRDEGYRYGDVAVIVRDLELYREFIETAFTAWEIPFFLDYKASAFHHPVVTLVRSALEVLAGGFDSEAVLRYLKTDLIPVSRNEVDRLENCVLKEGMNGRDWTAEEVWPADLRPMRRQAVGGLIAFDQTVRNLLRSENEESDGDLPKAPVRHLLRGLYSLLTELEVDERLRRWAQEAADAGERLQAQEHSQAWSGLCELIDHIGAVMGDISVSGEEFADVFGAGLKRLRLGRVPPRIDQVLVGSVERSRQPDLSAAILLGCNDGVFPAVPSEDAIFSDQDRERLERAGLRLGPTSRSRLFHEKYLVYIAMTRAAERLVLTYSRSDESGRPARPSPMVTWLRSTFPAIPFTQLPALVDSRAWPERAGALRGWLARALSACKEGAFSGQEKELLSAYEWSVTHDFGGGRRGVAQTGWAPKDPLSALSFANESMPLTADLVAGLYGEELMTSASALEDFASCPFRHFSAHGLRLEERALHRMDPSLFGLLNHSVLKRIVDVLRDRGLDWGDLERPESDRLVKEVVEEVAPRLIGGLLEGSATNRYVAGRLVKALQAVVWSLGEHARRGSFRPVAVEVTFGPGGVLPPVRVETENGRKGVIRGRIDRIDEARSGDRRFVRVVDYKSSPHPFRLRSLIYGIDLQLALYLTAVVEGEDAASARTPAGCLYIPVFDPLVSLEMPGDDRDEVWRKDLKATGLIVDDGESPRLMDSDSSGYSDLVPLFFKRDGTLGARSSVALPEQVRQMTAFVKQRAADLIETIAAGETSISPYELSGATPCTYCSYKPVCQFDATVRDNGYRRLAPADEKEAWETIARSISEGGEDRAG